MRYVRICLLIAQAVLLTGCSIWWKELLGEAQALDPKEWDGIWATTGFTMEGPESSFFKFRVVDSKKGILGIKPPCVDDPVEKYLQINAAPRPTLSGQRWQSDERLQFPVETKRDAKGEFIPIGQPQALSSEPAFQYWSFASRTPSGAWIFYPVDEDRVKLLVEQGALPGRVEQGHVIMGHLEAQHYDVLSSVERRVVVWENAVTVSVRLPRDFDPCKGKEPAK